MAFLAAINARNKVEAVDADVRPPMQKSRPSTTAQSMLPSAGASTARTRPSMDSSLLQPSNILMNSATVSPRPSSASRPSLVKRSSISFSISGVQTPLTQGREGSQISNMSKKIRDNKDLTEEKIELIYEAFQMFPLDDQGTLTSEALGDYYSRCGLVFTPDECDKMMGLFVGNPCKAINFEDFALAYIRCEKTLPTNSVIRIPVDSEMNIADRDNCSQRDQFFEALCIKDLGLEHQNHLVSGLKNLS